MEINANAEVKAGLETNHILDVSDRLYKVIMALGAVVAVCALGYLYYQFNNVPQNMVHEISVSGSGKAFIKPDIAQVSFGVTTEALKSQDAVNKNNEKMNAVIKAIKDLGVQDKDIQTTLYNLTPVYDYPRILTPGGVSSNSRVFTGYSLQQQVSVKIRNFDNINAILDKATSNGATNVSDLQFTVDDPEKVQAEARAMAITKAKEKLANMVAQSGLKVGKLVNISEGYNNYPMPMYASGMAKDSQESVAPQIQTGQQEVDSTVTLTYQIK